MDESKLMLEFLSNEFGTSDQKQILKQLNKLDKELKEALAQKYLLWKAKRKVKAAHGVKLDYFKSLKHLCADDEEVYYYKTGGIVNCGCKKKEEIKKASDVTIIDKFKNTRKALSGMEFPAEKKTIATKSSTTQLPKWNTKKDNELKKLSEKKTLTPEEKKRLQQLRNEFKNSSNAKDFELEEGKKGMKIEKDCGGAIAKFKAKCGVKMKKHKQGGNLIPFMQKGTPKGGLPTAPKATDRYKGAYVYTNGNGFIDNDMRYSNYPTTRIVSNVPYSMTPAIITESVVAPGDTLYTEYPELKRFSFRGLPVERKASTINQNGDEYNILRRRFREALSVANPNALHYFFK